ncbi:hypothetical protein G7081_03385 [Vagococcus coleopterorum]|uniref:Uncharacterized protein n=1 Tax=Vagococcus coleopterorum TaxID=2714946 RepID=A0A6G8AMK5_9ENTE|nr:hypothetical protein [Vagococcus coleopterorum]QIL46182.1 hypothetical protein G7081_03385 [Vagococcus coleopterorum]
MTKLNRRILMVILLILIVPILTHLTPKSALRTNLVTSGQIKTAFTADIKYLGKTDDDELAYEITPITKHKQAVHLPDHYLVKKELFYYLAEVWDQMDHLTP